MPSCAVTIPAATRCGLAYSARRVEVRSRAPRWIRAASTSPAATFWQDWRKRRRSLPFSRLTSLQACIVNAASHLGGAVAPGEIVTVYGSMIGPPELVSFDSAHSPLAKTLADTRILFNGVPAPLLYVSATLEQRDRPIQHARSVDSGRAGRVPGIALRCGHNARSDFRLGIYTVGGSEYGLGAILNEDGTINSPANPARRGSVITLYDGRRRRRPGRCGR